MSGTQWGSGSAYAEQYLSHTRGQASRPHHALLPSSLTHPQQGKGVHGRSPARLLMHLWAAAHCWQSGRELHTHLAAGGCLHKVQEIPHSVRGMLGAHCVLGDWTKKEVLEVRVLGLQLRVFCKLLSEVPLVQRGRSQTCGGPAFEAEGLLSALPALSSASSERPAQDMGAWRLF